MSFAPSNIFMNIIIASIVVFIKNSYRPSLYQTLSTC